jgi:HAD superfamily hydrolase (TIGR01509 family)
MAVASGGVRDNVILELETLEIRQFFGAILTADDDVRPKPAPDIFLEAANRLGVLPANCQVFEDGDLGLQAAREAGMLATDIREYRG